jgi:ABC-2 type transport system permease protein
VTYTRFLFRNEWRTAAFWAVGLCIYSGLIVLLFPSVKDAVNLDAIPPNLRKAFNIDDFTQLASFLSSQLLGVILPLLLPFFGMIRMSNVVAGAEEQGRMDMLLGQPIPRWHLIAGNVIVVASLLLCIVWAIGVTIWTVAAVLGLDLTIAQAMRAAFMLWPTSVAFSALALLVSTFVRQRSTALLIPASAVFVMYLLNVIGRLAPDVSGIRYASAYNYYGSAITDGIWWGGVTVLLVSTLILVLVAIAQFERRDIFA